MPEGPSHQFDGDGPLQGAPESVKATLLVVDDEPAVRRVLVMRLQPAGYRVVCAEDGEEALEMFHRESPDLVVLDDAAQARWLRGVPQASGRILCAHHFPVGTGSNLRAGCRSDLGADDYLPKPFSPKELEARIATILRRVGRGSATSEPKELPTGQGVVRVGDLVVDTNRRQVTRGSERISLTYTEFSLLELLFREPGRVVPRAEISNSSASAQACRRSTWSMYVAPCAASSN